MCDCGRWSCDSCRNEMYWRSIGLRRTSQQQFARSAQLRIDRENRIAERKRPVYKNRMYADNNQPPQIAAPLNGQFAIQYGGVQGPDIVVQVQPRGLNRRIFGDDEDMELLQSQGRKNWNEANLKLMDKEGQYLKEWEAAWDANEQEKFNENVVYLQEQRESLRERDFGQRLKKVSTKGDAPSPTKAQKREAAIKRTQKKLASTVSYK